MKRSQKNESDEQGERGERGKKEMEEQVMDMLVVHQSAKKLGALETMTIIQANVRGILLKWIKDGIEKNKEWMRNKVAQKFKQPRKRQKEK